MLGDRLKLVREEMMLTQNTVAQFLNVKRQTYSAYERNKSIPDAITLSKLATYFRVTTDFLLGQELENCKEELNIISESVNSIFDTSAQLNNHMIQVKMVVQGLIGLLHPIFKNEGHDSESIVRIINEGVQMAIKEYHDKYLIKK